MRIPCACSCREVCWGNASYQGQTEAIHEAAPGAQDMTSRCVKTKQCVDEEQNPSGKVHTFSGFRNVKYLVHEQAARTSNIAACKLEAPKDLIAELGFLQCIGTKNLECCTRREIPLNADSTLVYAAFYLCCSPFQWL
jgi:hypothetical protein